MRPRWGGGPPPAPDPPTVDALAEIGVVLLLFSVGIESPVRELLRSGRAALLGAHLQVGASIAIGMGVGALLGWSTPAALVLGAVVSNSSSTVLMKIAAERGESGAPHARLALAWSTVQDLTTVLLSVAIIAVANDGDLLDGDLAVGLGRAAIFLTVLVPLGAVVLPFVFNRLRGLRNREVFVLSAAGIAMLTAYAATLFGLSPALGAFLAGIVLSESDIRHEVLNGIVPLRDIFVGLFFVSIGMLLDPAVVTGQPLVLLIVLGLILSKALISPALAMLVRQTPRISLRAGAALAQSAEFSFVMTSLAVGLGVLAQDQSSVILVAAALSVVASPVMHEVARRLGAFAATLSREPAEVRDATLVDHAIIAGHGRVGGVVAGTLSERNIPLVVIDEDPEVVRRIRETGGQAWLGSADNAVLLGRAGIEKATLLVLAVPDRAVTARAIDLARAANSDIRIVVRSHEIAERDQLRARGVAEVVIPELEAAIEMARFALRHFDVDDPNAQRELEDLREPDGSAP